MLKEGLTHTCTLTVTHDKTALAVGSGDLPVLATPAMLALMEQAAMLAVRPALTDGQTTVGGHIASSHLRPTALHATVSATATLTRIEGRKLHFHVSAREGDTLIGEGTHLRFIVDRDKFLARLS